MLTKAARSNGTTGNTYYKRALSGITSGIFSCRMRIDITNPNGSVGPILVDTATEGDGGKMFVRFGPTGYIEAWDYTGPGYVQLQTYQANTWYTIYIEFDDSAQPENYRVKVDSGAWSSWYLVNGSSYTQIDSFRIRDLATNAHEFWLDNIGGTGNWVATDDFQSYTPTSDLDTLNGGSNWGGAWVKTGTGAVTVEETDAEVLVSQALAQVEYTVDPNIYIPGVIAQLEYLPPPPRVQISESLIQLEYLPPPPRLQLPELMVQLEYVEGVPGTGGGWRTPVNMRSVIGSPIAGRA